MLTNKRDILKNFDPPSDSVFSCVELEAYLAPKNLVRSDLRELYLRLQTFYEVAELLRSGGREPLEKLSIRYTNGTPVIQETDIESSD